MNRKTVLLFMIITLASCHKGPEFKEGELKSEINLKTSAEEYYNAINGSLTSLCDPFVLHDFKISGDTVKISVSYTGGCSNHVFNIIWNEVLTDTYPPKTGLIITHNSNGDQCEAYITETLEFIAGDLIDSVNFDTLCVGIVNGWDISDSTSWGGWEPIDTTSTDDGVYAFVFHESDTCLVPVTAMNVICGTGLFSNLWFATDDSVTFGNDEFYFRNYLQPVAVVENLKNFVPEKGKKYLIGAKIEKENIYSDIPVCLAYSGPSVPVKILCISEFK